MGMIDWVRVPCPRCKQVTEIQSKAWSPDRDPPSGMNYDVSTCPSYVAVWLDGMSQVCTKCHAELVVEVQVSIHLKPAT